MKKLIILCVLSVMMSCGVSTYYQIYKATPEGGVLTKEYVQFEDNNCIVNYDLWSNGGYIDFYVFNKTDNDLTVDLTKSFFAMNGESVQYFQNRVFSNSTNYGTTVSKSYYSNSYWSKSVSKLSATSSSISYNEKPELIIPPKTRSNISIYNVTDERYINCDLADFPSSRDNEVLKFDKTNSPFIFNNIITYSANGMVNRFDNKFYVSEIANYSSSNVKVLISVTECGKHLEYPYSAFKDVSPDKFYIKYTNQ
ncbi:MAG: hypothetical protein WCQ95_00855 [Bacteroidota bacterium]